MHPTGPNRPCTARASAANYGSHVLNRGNNRAAVFHKDQDYEEFSTCGPRPACDTPGGGFAGSWALRGQGRFSVSAGLRFRGVRSVRGPAASCDE